MVGRYPFENQCTWFARQRPEHPGCRSWQLVRILGQFLRHVERAGILVHVVEPAPLDGSDPLTNYKKIRQELSLYDESLGARPEILVVSKSELAEAKTVREELSSETGLHVIAVSAVTGDGLPQLLQTITKKLKSTYDSDAP